METVPQMISTKDLSYIEDMANWVYTLSKKANHYTNEVTDDVLKSNLGTLAVRLKQHYQMLLNVLETGGNNESE